VNSLVKNLILSIAIFFCGAVVEAQTKVVLEKDIPVSKQITTENTIYVLKDEFTLDKNLTVPNNCVLEMDGGKILGNNNIYLGENCKITGHGVEEIIIGGAVFLNYGTFIGDINLIRNTIFENAEESFIIVSDEYIKHHFGGSANTQLQDRSAISGCGIA
jgi:hypothetical protein